MSNESANQRMRKEIAQSYIYTGYDRPYLLLTHPELAPFAHQFSPFTHRLGTTLTWDQSLRIKVSALLLIFPNPLNYFAQLVLEHVKCSHNRLKWCENHQQQAGYVESHIHRPCAVEEISMKCRCWQLAAEMV